MPYDFIEYNKCSNTIQNEVTQMSWEYFVEETDLIPTAFIESWVIIDKSNNKPVGLMELSNDSGYEINIGCFEIQADLRNKGIGSLAIKDYISFVKRPEIKYITLAPADELAEKFWKKNGFVDLIKTKQINPNYRLICTFGMKL